MIGSGDGCFYVIQLDPTARPTRVKVGFSKNVRKRLQTYRTANPEAQVLRYWACSTTKVEQDVLAYLSFEKCCTRVVGSEVFDFKECETFLTKVEEVILFAEKNGFQPPWKAR